MAERFVDISKVLSFVERTTSYGVPLRVALTRASRRFDVDRAQVRAFYRGAK